MPIYEYMCKECNKKVEVLVRSYDATDISCPECGGKHLDKQWSVPGVVTGAQPDNTPCCGRQERCDAAAPQCPGPGMCGH